MKALCKDRWKATFFARSSSKGYFYPAGFFITTPPESHRHQKTSATTEGSKETQRWASESGRICIRVGVCAGQRSRGGGAGTAGGWASSHSPMIHVCCRAGALSTFLSHEHIMLPICDDSAMFSPSLVSLLRGRPQGLLGPVRPVHEGRAPGCVTWLRLDLQSAKQAGCYLSCSKAKPPQLCRSRCAKRTPLLPLTPFKTQCRTWIVYCVICVHDAVCFSSLYLTFFITVHSK